MNKYDKLLNAEDLKDAIEYDLGENDIIYIKDLFDLIDRQNPAEAEPVVHAHWEHTESDYFRCTNCGNEICTGCSPRSDGTWMTPTRKRCPKCDAKMDEEATHETD